MVSQTDENGGEVRKFCAAHDKEISFCAKMSNEKKDFCAECEQSYYLDSNTCVKRGNVIDNCAKLMVNADFCETCEDAFLLNTENTLCLQKIENC